LSLLGGYFSVILLFLQLIEITVIKVYSFACCSWLVTCFIT